MENETEKNLCFLSYDQCFDEIINKIERLQFQLQLNGELLTYLSNKLDKFIKQVEEDNADGK